MLSNSFLRCDCSMGVSIHQSFICQNVSTCHCLLGRQSLVQCFPWSLDDSAVLFNRFDMGHSQTFWVCHCFFLFLTSVSRNIWGASAFYGMAFHRLHFGNKKHVGDSTRKQHPSSYSTSSDSLPRHCLGRCTSRAI